MPELTWQLLVAALVLVVLIWAIVRLLEARTRGTHRPRRQRPMNEHLEQSPEERLRERLGEFVQDLHCIHVRLLDLLELVAEVGEVREAARSSTN